MQDPAGAEEVVVAATFKILVLGDSNVGKSSLVKSYSSGRQAKDLLPTIGMDFIDVVVSVQGTKVKLQLWDTAGQEKYHTFTKQFFRRTHGIMLVYDITQMDTFQMLRKWMQTIAEEGLSDASTVIVGNKADLEDYRAVPKEHSKKLVAHNFKTQCIETSVATGYNVKRAFYLLAESLVHSHNIFQPGTEATNAEESNGDLRYTRSDSIKLGTKPDYPKKSQKCCNS